ncbi:MAG: TolC family protein [Bacteroidota bacterium]|nr:TolC family protein [Bacteroidota bacterium]
MNKFDKDKMVLTDTLYFPKYHIKNKEAFLDTLLLRALPLQTQNERLNQDDRKYDIRIAKAYLYPTVSTGFEYRKDFVTQLPPKPAAYVDFSYNVFDWGVSNKKKQIAMLDYQIYQNNINQRKQEIDQMIKNNFYSMEQFLSLADPSVLDGYRKVYNIMKFKLLNGEYIISDFITAQNDYYTAVENYYINLRNAIEQEIRLRQTFNDYISPIEELGRNVVLIKDV